jgi:putative SOS response-associated peptidase YedK
LAIPTSELAFCGGSKLRDRSGDRPESTSRGWAGKRWRYDVLPALPSARAGSMARYQDHSERVTAMCYSAMVEQSLKRLSRRFNSQIDLPLFENLFERRLTDSSIKICKALEAEFYSPASPPERRIHELIETHRASQRKKWEEDLFKQKKRFADAERTLKTKLTKKAENDHRIAAKKIETLLKNIQQLNREELKPSDSRIFPMGWAPVIVEVGGERVIRPMRYHCRPDGKPANYDQRYPGLYNARRDNLTGFWKSLYGTHHGIFVVNSFFENVKKHDYEHRDLRPGEEPENIVVHFNPQPGVEMWVACLWSHWEGKGESLDSFAAITDEPPHEIAATGHNRCIVPIKEANRSTWLNPVGHAAAELDSILEDRERWVYEHRLAA